MSTTEISAAKSEIVTLIDRYAHWIDEGKFDEIADLLGDTEFNVAGSVSHGREGILKALLTGVQRHDDGTPRTWHVTTNALVEVDLAKGTATASSKFTVFQQLDGFPLQPIVTGRYDDGFVRTADAWQFYSRSVTPVLFGDLSKHVA